MFRVKTWKHCDIWESRKRQITKRRTTDKQKRQRTGGQRRLYSCGLFLLHLLCVLGVVFVSSCCFLFVSFFVLCLFP